MRHSHRHPRENAEGIPYAYWNDRMGTPETKNNPCFNGHYRVLHSEASFPRRRESPIPIGTTAWERPKRKTILVLLDTAASFTAKCHARESGHSQCLLERPHGNTRNENNPCFNGNLVKSRAENKPPKAWAMPWQARLGSAK